MKKTLLIIAIIALAGLGIWQHQNSQTSTTTSDKPVIKIGVSLPLTGDMAFAGHPVKKALEISMRDMQKNNKLKYDYELIFEDDRLDSKTTLLNYNRLKSINKINAIISMWGNAVVISEPADRDGIIHFGCAWGYELGKGFYNFNHSTLPDEQIGKLIEGLKKHNVKKLGIIYNTTKGDYELISFLKDKLKDTDIEIVFDNIFQAEQKDFKAEIIKMREKETDAVLLFLISPGMEIFMKQANELNYHPKYTSINYFTYNPQLFEGLWYVSDAAGTNEFREYFTQETNENSSNSCVSNLYSALQILVDAFEKTDVAEGSVPTNKDVAQTILDMESRTDSTGKIYIDKEGNIHSNATLNIIKNGQPVLLEE